MELIYENCAKEMLGKKEVRICGNFFFDDEEISWFFILLRRFGDIWDFHNLYSKNINISCYKLPKVNKWFETTQDISGRY